MRDKILALVAQLDAKYRRANTNDLTPIDELKSVEIVKSVITQVQKRQHGQFELVSDHLPEYDDLPDMPELDDSQIDNAYEEFDRILIEIVGKTTTWVCHPPVNNHPRSILFSD